MNQMKDQTVPGPSASGSLAVEGGQSQVWGSCYALSASLTVTLEETVRGHGAQMLKVPWYSLLLGSLARPPCSFFLELTALFWEQAHLEEEPGQCV